MADFPRQPIYVKYWYPWRSPQDQYGINLCLAVPPPATSIPNRQSDWPLPIPAPNRQYLTSQPLGVRWLQRCAFQFGAFQDNAFQVCQQPFAQDDWPLPIRPYIVRHEATGAFIPLLHSTRPPFIQLDWPLPIRPYRVVAEAVSVPQPLLYSVKPPNRLNDWPLPIRPYIVRAEAVSVPLPIAATLAKPPNRQSEWPHIRPYIVRVEPVGVPLGLLTSVQPPNRLDNWPVPQRAQWPLVEPQQHSPVLAAVVVAAAVPFAQADWPVPQRAQWPLVEPQQRSLALTTAIIAVPFRQADWPNPQQAQWPISARTWINAAITAAQPSPPIGQFAWPVPTSVLVPQAQSYSTPLTLFPAPVVPPVVVDEHQDYWGIGHLKLALAEALEASRKGKKRRDLTEAIAQIVRVEAVLDKLGATTPTEGLLAKPPHVGPLVDAEWAELQAKAAELEVMVGKAQRATAARVKAEEMMIVAERIRQRLQDEDDAIHILMISGVL